jgi:hypothetical protein
MRSENSETSVKNEVSDLFVIGLSQENQHLKYSESISINFNDENRFNYSLGLPKLGKRNHILPGTRTHFFIPLAIRDCF